MYPSSSNSGPRLPSSHSQNAPRAPPNPINVNFNLAPPQTQASTNQVPVPGNNQQMTPQYGLSFPVAPPHGMQNYVGAVQQAQLATNQYLTTVIAERSETGRPMIQGSQEAKRVHRAARSAQFTQDGSQVPQVSSSGIPCDPAPSAPKALCPHGFPYSALECQYSPSHWSARKQHPNQVVANFVKKMAEASTAANSSQVPRRLNVPYGEGSGEMIDFYGTGNGPPGKPLFAFIHGGYWEEGSRQLSTVMVPPLVQAGCAVALVGYDLANLASMDQMVNEVARALKFLDDWCSKNGGSRLYLVGHSAGAHLAAMGLLRLNHRVGNLGGLVLLSGIFDLIPIVGTYIDKPLRLNKECATRNSPEFMVKELVERCGDARILVAVGEFDSPVFKENSHRMAAKMGQYRPAKPAGFHVVPGEDHFSLIENMANREYVLNRILLSTMLSQ